MKLIYHLALRLLGRIIRLVKAGLGWKIRFLPGGLEEGGGLLFACRFRVP